jgi:hypothetical protein
MNVNQTTEFRELSGTELNDVSGAALRPSSALTAPKISTTPLGD